jgi:hypothetical protein
MRDVLKNTNTEARARPGQYSGGHDSRKARIRRLHVRLAYVMRVDNRESVAYAADSARSAWAVYCSGGHDAHKASTRRLHARLAYVVRVDDHARVAHVAATPAV